MLLETGCLGIDGIFSQEEDMKNLIGYTATKGTRIVAYNGAYYLYKYGKIDNIISCSIKDRNKNNYELVDSNFTTNNSCVWNLKVHGSIETDDYTDIPMDKYCAFTNENENGFAVIHVLDSDVLPSYCPGEKVKLQMTAMSLSEVEYFENEEQYLEKTEVKNGKKNFNLGIGSVFPAGFFNSDACKAQKAATIIAGKVKGAYFGNFRIDENDKGYPSCIYLFVDTSFGEIALVHSRSQVKEGQKDLIKEGSIIRGVFELVGDAAIDEYETGIIKDLDHNLRALQYSIHSKDPNRLFDILDDNVIYERDTDEDIYEGKEKVIERFDFVNKNCKTGIQPSICEITEIGDDDKILEVGEKCISFQYDTPNVENIFKINVNKDGLIDHIYSIRKSSCKFSILHPFDNVKAYDYDDLDIVNSNITRAEWNGLISSELFEELMEEEKQTELLEQSKEYALQEIKNIDINKLSESVEYSTEVFSEYFQKCFEDEISLFSEEEKNLIVDISKQYHKDYDFIGKNSNDNKEDLLIKSLSALKVIASQMIIEKKKQYIIYSKNN